MSPKKILRKNQLSFAYSAQQIYAPDNTPQRKSILESEGLIPQSMYPQHLPTFNLTYHGDQPDMTIILTWSDRTLLTQSVFHPGHVLTPHTIGLYSAEQMMKPQPRQATSRSAYPITPDHYLDLATLDKAGPPIIHHTDFVWQDKIMTCDAVTRPFKVTGTPYTILGGQQVTDHDRHYTFLTYGTPPRDTVVRALATWHDNAQDPNFTGVAFTGDRQFNHLKRNQLKPIKDTVLQAMMMTPLAQLVMR